MKPLLRIKINIKVFFFKAKKANSALVYFTIADNDDKDVPSDATLAWFRLERTQLLAASSTETLNSEKKIREVIKEFNIKIS